MHFGVWRTSPKFAGEDVNLYLVRLTAEFGDVHPVPKCETEHVNIHCLQEFLVFEIDMAYTEFQSLSGGEGVKANQATAEVFFTAFKALKSDERAAFIEKVVCDPSMRDDLIDIALIEEAKKVKGKSVSAADYFEKRRGKEKVS